MEEEMSETESVFSKLSDDVVLNILFKLEDDPRYWARLACVSTKFSSLIWDVCCKTKCSQTIPSVVNDLLSGTGGSGSGAPPGGWAALYKLAVSCPGIRQAGVLLENSDFGLLRELGPEENFRPRIHQAASPAPAPVSASALATCSSRRDAFDSEVNGSDNCWSLFDDLFYDTVYDTSEATSTDDPDPTRIVVDEEPQREMDQAGSPAAGCKKKRKICRHRSLKSHLAKGVWNLSREQGNKLLNSRFKGDCLYICDWPGCVHVEEKRNYMLFRGIFKNFKQSRVWRTINDGHRSKIELNCAFCACKETWDLHSAFCLRRYFGFHDDGEPVVRAYVCENGHVSGAWTDWPLYT
ncbi:OLC1v1004361C1 [Oldenlandia corymbosa var. corymbosa]|uniref:OLC1v1004361C1 n=1 Tax=Oldenlandia corymbosa var. corymbosa TaxID=529605 RepID=A0AAV1DDD1_OLDCO|nr:OLC1v1004361C1 [Oldenlandia corymbosa var. corymbosa]